jgi:hypothetical protein
MSELLIALKARRDAAKDFSMNNDMYVESYLLIAQIKAIEKREVAIKGFEVLLNHFEKCAIINAESGGGHPEDIPLKKADYKMVRAELLSYINDLI